MDDATCFVVRDVVAPGTRVTWVSLFRPVSLLLDFRSTVFRSLSFSFVHCLKVFDFISHESKQH